MAKRLDAILVVDVEATCWAGPPPEGEHPEIIEIGICRLPLDTLRPAEAASILVRPQNSRVSGYCTELTTLTPEQVARGVTFAEACATLAGEYGSHSHPWASYGDFDRIMFEAECRDKNVQFPFGDTHLNVKNLAAIAAGLRDETGLPPILKRFGLRQLGTLHRGNDDAANIALLLARILSAVRTHAAGAPVNIKPSG